MKRGPRAGMVMSTGWGLKTLTRDALDKIHAATLDVLQSTGVRVDSQEALKILAKEGCWVNVKTGVVKFPEHLVKQVELYLRRGQHAVLNRPVNDVQRHCGVLLQPLVCREQLFRVRKVLGRFLPGCFGSADVRVQLSA